MADSIGHYSMQVGITAQETGAETVVHAQHILYNQHLAVHAATGADADDGNSQLACHTLCQRSGNLLQYKGKASGFFLQVGVASASSLARTVYVPYLLID